jgi:hypothetical protein
VGTLDVVRKCGLVFGAGGEVFVAEVFGPDDADKCDPVPHRKGQIGNQHLIAAAPDLYAALDACLDLIHNVGESHTVLFDQVVNALAKARGEVSDG